MIIDLCSGIGRFESDNEEVINIDIKNATTHLYLSKKSQKRAIIPKDIRQQILELTKYE